MSDRIDESQFKFKGEEDPLDKKQYHVEFAYQLENELHKIMETRRLIAGASYPEGQYVDAIGMYEIFILGAKSMRRELLRHKSPGSKWASERAHNWLKEVTSTITPHKKKRKS